VLMRVGAHLVAAVGPPVGCMVLVHVAKYARAAPNRTHPPPGAQPVAQVLGVRLAQGRAYFGGPCILILRGLYSRQRTLSVFTTFLEGLLGAQGPLVAHFWGPKCVFWPPNSVIWIRRSLPVFCLYFGCRAL
jgi:hypothetical protein